MQSLFCCCQNNNIVPISYTELNISFSIPQRKIQTMSESSKRILWCEVITQVFFFWAILSHNERQPFQSIVSLGTYVWPEPSRAGLLTQVCVIGFAELLLSTKAELKLRLIWSAQGVSILKSSEGVTGVAVCDKAKIVPGLGKKMKCQDALLHINPNWDQYNYGNYCTVFVQSFSPLTPIDCSKTMKILPS